MTRATLVLLLAACLLDGVRAPEGHGDPRVAEAEAKRFGHHANVASMCGVVGEDCHEDEEEYKNMKGERERHPMGHPEDRAHECCDGLICAMGDSKCHRPWGAAAPTGKELKELYDLFTPGHKNTEEQCQRKLDAWKGREERLLTSLRLRHRGAMPKDEL